MSTAPIATHNMAQAMNQNESTPTDIRSQMTPDKVLKPATLWIFILAINLIKAENARYTQLLWEHLSEEE